MSEWMYSKVEDLFSMGRGRVISGIEIANSVGNYPVFSSQTSNNGCMGFIGSFDFEGELVTWTTDGANAGTVFYRSGKFNCTNVCGTLKAKSNEIVDYRFFAYLLNTLAKSHVSYIGNPKLMNGIMGKIKVQYPPKSEQQQIAQILDTLDTTIQQTEAIIQKLNQVKQGLLHDLLTRGIDANGELRPSYDDAPHLYKESPLGWIPKEWEVCYVHQVAEVIDPQPDHRTPKELENGAPYIGIGDFDENGEIRSTACRKVVWSALLKQESRFSIQSGDIIYGKIGTIGQPKVLPVGRYALTANVLLIKPKCNRSFFYYSLLTSRFEKQILDITNTTSQPALGIQTVRLLLICVAPEAEQIEVASQFDTLDAQLMLEQKTLMKLKQQKTALMDDLLTGRVRVTSLLQAEANTA